jgi:hypothetical protein
MTLDRRTFLKCIGAVAGAGLVGAGGQSARAGITTEPVSILVLDFVGGWNVHASFAARTHPDVNAHGIFKAQDTGILTTSSVLYDGRDQLVKMDAPSWGTRIPGFESAARSFSLIGSMRHSEKFFLDDHVQTARMGGTGYLDRIDCPGLGTIIGKTIGNAGNGPPAVVIDPGGVSGQMASAPGAYQPYGPLVLSHTKLPISADSAPAWTITEDALDAAARPSHRSLGLGKLELLARQKRAFHQYREFFVDPAIGVASDANAQARYTKGLLGSASPTTQQLLSAFGGTGYADEYGMALAVRCLEGGARFVAVGLGSHDTHSHETDASGVYVKDAHIMAGLSFVLQKLGLDRKVLVVAMSEMARSPYAGGMYNQANGTDHGATGLVTPRGLHGSNRQSVLLAHGPIVPGREAYPADPEYGDPLGASCITAELLAMLAECAGVPRADHPWKDSPEGVSLSADALAKVLLA